MRPLVWLEILREPMKTKAERRGVVCRLIRGLTVIKRNWAFNLGAMES